MAKAEYFILCSALLIITSRCAFGFSLRVYPGYAPHNNPQRPGSPNQPKEDKSFRRSSRFVVSAANPAPLHRDLSYTPDRKSRMP